MWISIKRELWLALAVLGTGCGTGINLDDMPVRSAKAMCGKVYECCAATQLPDNSQLAPDEATCESTLTSNLTGKRNLIRSEQNKGRVVYHGDRLDECIQRLGNATCQSLKSNATSNFPICDTYLEPKVMAGGPCRLDEECIGGSCIGTTLDQDGVCHSFAAEGESCAEAVCGVGLYCVGGTKTCQRAKDDGASCNVNAECATGECNGRDVDAGTPGTCGLKGGPGTPCFVTSGCASTGGGAAVPWLAAAIALLLCLRVVRPSR